MIQDANKNLQKNDTCQQLPNIFVDNQNNSNTTVTSQEELKK